MEFEHINACQFCIDGFQPGGTHDALGAYYFACVACTRPCPGCDSIALLVIGEPCYACLRDRLAPLGWGFDICGYCAAITSLYTLSSIEAAKEVHDHDHHH